jgi:hypothetical protein
MTEAMDRQELNERLALIASMIAEGRRSTGSWAWTFVFWGVAYYVAILWTAMSHWPWAWLVTMASAWVVSWAIIQRKQKNKAKSGPGTAMGRAIFSIWITMGVSLSLLLSGLGFSGRFNQHVFVAVVAAMLGIANGASGMIIHWKAQIASACVWWTASVAACFGTDDQCTVVFLVAIFLGQIVFGSYAMSCEARLRRQEASHA